MNIFTLFKLEFSSLQVHAQLLANGADLGLTKLTPVQEKLIPALLSGEDAIVTAPTGTGKTEAFAVPLIENLLLQPVAKEHSKLIIVPTRELCLQVKERLEKLSRGTGIGIAALYGGATYEEQLLQYRTAHILVATPGRLLDLVQQGHVRLTAVDTLIIDEFDQLLELGFIKELLEIVRLLPATRQTVFLSATQTVDILKLSRKILRKPIELNLIPDQQQIDEKVFFVDKSDKKALIKYLFDRQQHTHVLIFTRTIHGVDRIVKDLQQSGIPAAALYGDMSQKNRTETLQQFRDQQLPVLVATDLLSRGIDIAHLNLVINYEVPDTPELYTHRIGRVGRAGATGSAYTFCDAQDNQKWIQLQLNLKRQIRIDDTHPYLLSWQNMLTSSQARQKKSNPKNRKGR